MIECKDLMFVYDGKMLFEHFTEQVTTGEKVVIYGASGSGKSTLLSSLAGFVPPVQGEIVVDGMVMNDRNVSTIRSRLAWVPQEFSLPYQDVNGMIEAIFHLKSNRMKLPVRDLVLAYFSDLGLSDEIYGKRLSDMSGGQRQRVMLAIAALLDKDILLLDEPTSALDGDSVVKVIRFLKGMERKTVVAVSHDSKFIYGFDRVIHL